MKNAASKAAPEALEQQRRSKRRTKAVLEAELRVITARAKRLEVLVMQKKHSLSTKEELARRHALAEAHDRTKLHGILLAGQAWESRPYQFAAVLGVLDWSTRHPTGRILLVVPPAGGKTLIVASLLRAVAAAGLRALVVVHRRELVEQHCKHLELCGLPSESIGIIMAGDKRQNADAPIQVASIDTLNRHRGRWPDAQIVVTDEAHRDASDTRRALRAHYANALRLGITATPHRLDGRGLALDYDEMIIGATVSALIADGYLAAPKTFTVPLESLPDLRRVRIIHGDYDRRALSRAASRKSLIGALPAHWKLHADGLSTVVFAASVRHSKRIVEAFRKAGVTAAHIDSRTPVRERAEILQRFAQGEIMVVSSVDVLAEGWDCLRCKCVIQARPTLSFNLHIQQTGRAMRVWNGVVPIILDHAGNAVVHGLPQMDVPWSLESPSRDASPMSSVRVCKTCYAVMPSTAEICTECATAFPKRERTLDEKPGVLREYVISEEDKAADLEQIRLFASSKGLDEVWVQHVFHAKYGLADVQPRTTN